MLASKRKGDTMTPTDYDLKDLKELCGYKKNTLEHAKAAAEALNALPVLIAKIEKLEAQYAKAIEMRDAESSRADAAHDAYREMLEIRASQDVQVAELTLALAKLEAERRWIPVSESLPEEASCVLTWNGDFVGGGFMELVDGSPEWNTGLDVIYGVTHWRALPVAPEEK
jgi:hypothetical protein